MKELIFIVSLNFLFSCGTDWRHTQERQVSKSKTIKTQEYELIIPTDQSNTVLILMGGNADGIKREFDILDESYTTA